MSAEPTTAARPTTTPPRSTAFRRDIQGIRAVAVLLVIVNHIAPGRLPGGYVGVDVFFVVSGYLITSLLVAEADRSERISLPDFFARRARRILPAATVVTVVTSLASLATLSLLRTQTVLTDAVWATFFAANIRFALVGTDYFAQGQPPSPLRHYWSLSVEEQFYLVWPALLALVLLVLHARGRASGARFHRAAGVLIGAITLGSIGWSVWATYDSPVTAYFSSFARAYELAIGAACALVATRVRWPSGVRAAAALLGLVGIAAAALFYSERTHFPGVAALLPVVATALLILAGEGDATPAPSRPLTLRPMVVVGDWSYSLYLWHWPLIVLLRSNLGPERFSALPVRVVTLVAIFVLSWASFRWIETPFRKGRTWRRPSRALLVYPVSIAMVLATVAASTQVVRFRLGEFSDNPAITAGDYPDERLGTDRYVALVRASVEAAQQGRPVPSHLTPGLVDLRAQTASLGECDYRTGTHRLCPIGDPDAERAIVVLGDSHARALSPAVEEIGRRDGFRVYVLVYSGCSANSLVQVDGATGRAWQDCEDFKSWALDTIGEMHPDLVVVSTSAGRVLEPGTTDRVLTGARRFGAYLAALQQGWHTLFEELGTRSDHVYVVGNTPKLPRETGVCLSRGDPDLGDCAFPPGDHARREAKASFAAAREGGAVPVDAGRWFCADDLCPSVVGSYITMRDSEHMTPDYARWLAPALAVELGLGSPTAS
jgi:peptidoglycan/LPS O-acetylase OafA/YrhL